MTDSEQSGLTHFSSTRPLMVLADHPFHGGGGGGVILRSILAQPDLSRILWVTPAAATAAMSGVVRTIYLRSGRHGNTRPSLGRDILFGARALADEALQAAERAGCRAIWAVLHGSVVAIAERLVADVHGLPVHVSVHDDPAYGIALRSRRYVALAPVLQRRLLNTLAGARSVDVVSEGMKRRYAGVCTVEPVIVHRALSNPVESARRHLAAGQCITVGVIGNVYSEWQLLVLARALSMAAKDNRVQGRLIVIGSGYGGRFRRRLQRLVAVEMLGHVDEEKAVDHLRQCFMLYVNYPFSLRYTVLRRTSFPTKLSTYVQAARPLLLHAPTDSSVACLGTYEGYVHWWASTGAKDGAQVIASAWRQPRQFESWREAAESVRREHFDARVNRGTMLSSLNALVGPLP